MSTTMTGGAPMAGGGPVRTTAQPGAAQQQGGARQVGAGAQNPLNPTYINANQFGPQATLQQILAGFMPQARQATAGLNSDLAAAGIVGGGAQSAQNLLQGQLTSSLAPSLASAIQGSQGMQLTADQSNQQAANNARSQLAQYLMQGWQIPYEAQAGLAGSALSGFGGLAGSEANNFAVPPPQTLLSMLGIT